MQQGLKLQQSGNSAKLLLAEAVHRRTMRCNELIQVKRHHAQLKVKSSCRSHHFSQKQFSKWRQILISIESPHKDGSKQKCLRDSSPGQGSAIESGPESHLIALRSTEANTSS
jgi:hypothetical protein